MFAFAVRAWEESPLRKRFEALSGRERRLALGVAVALVLFLIYSVVGPLLTFHDTALARHAAEQRDLRWMQANREAAQAPSQRNDDNVEPQSRLSAINAVANEHGLTLRRIQPEEGAVSVQIENKPFEKVMRWSHALETRHGLEIVDASVDEQAPGTVNARFRFR